VERKVDSPWGGISLVSGILRASWLLSAYLEQVYVPSRPGLLPGSVEQLRVSISLLERFFGGPVSLADLSEMRLGAWMRWLAESRAPATVNGKRGAILTLWRAAVQAGLANVLGALRVAKLVEPRPVPIAWTLIELSRILAVCAKCRGHWGPLRTRDAWPALILLLWDSAARIGSARGARLEDIDLAARTWYVPAADVKGHREARLFFLSAQTVAALRLIAKPPRELLFPYPRDWRELWPEYKALLRRAKLPCDRWHLFHCLRRTAESYAANRRGIEWAAAAVGHGRDVAEKSYISPRIFRWPRLIDALPRPKFRRA